MFKWMDNIKMGLGDMEWGGVATQLVAPQLVPNSIQLVSKLIIRQALLTSLV
jgi:hypothetical protein